MKLSELKIENVKRAYNGKSGCMCGCIGDYTESQNKVSRRFNAVVKNPESKIKLDKLGNPKFAYFDTGSRITAVYFNA